MKHDDRQGAGPWKWQLITALEAILTDIRAQTTILQEIASQNSTKAKLSAAGKKSAEARKAKYGDAKPGSNGLFGIPRQSIETNPKVQVGTTTLVLPIGPEGDRDPVQPKVRKKKEPKPPKPVSDGSLVWDSYEVAYYSRYKVEPLRSAKTNALCKQLVGLVGAGVAAQLAIYYLSRDDAFYVNAKHPLGLLVLNAQKLHTERTTGNVVTMTDARRIESQSQTERAIRQYAASQEGK